MTQHLLQHNQLYKWLMGNKGGYEHGEYDLPHDGQPGAWLPAVEGPLVPCQNGYHACREQDLVYHIRHTLAVLEYADGSERLDGDDKVCLRGPVRIVRIVETWNKRSLQLWQADVVEHVAYLYVRPSDALGQATEDKLLAAAARAVEASRAAAAGGVEAVGDTASTWDKVAAEMAAFAASAWAGAARERGWQTQQLLARLAGWDEPRPAPEMWRPGWDTGPGEIELDGAPS